MKLTHQTIKDIILQVLEDMDLILPLPLKAEPTSPGEEPPEVIQESVEEKIMSVLLKMKPERRASIFNRFGFVKQADVTAKIQSNILKNISNINRAQKGDL
jgi:hypothetical protein